MMMVSPNGGLTLLIFASIVVSGHAVNMARRIVVIVKTRAKQVAVIEVDSGLFRVAVTAAPEGGQANRAVIKLMAEHLQVPGAHVRIVLGKTSREKLLEIK